MPQEVIETKNLIRIKKGVDIHMAIKISRVILINNKHFRKDIKPMLQCLSHSLTIRDQDET